MSAPATNESIDGLSVEAAVETVLATRDVDDPETVRMTLQHVTDDGVVSHDAAEQALAHASKVVATPETRVELVEQSLADAKATAEPFIDEPVVETRLDRLQARFETVRDQSEDLSQQLATTLDADALYETAVGIQTLRTNAGNVQTAADDLLLDVRRFESWIEEPTVRCDDLTGDADLLEEAADDVAGEVGELPTDDRETAARQWAATAMHHRTLELMLSDLRWELQGVQRIDERQGIEHDSSEAERRIDAVARQLSTVEDRLAEAGTPAVRGRHEEQVTALERVLDEKEPPVSWGTIQRVFEQHREAL